MSNLMSNWVQWLIDHNSKWVVYVIVVISFPFTAMFGYWSECFEAYRYTFQSIKATQKRK